MPLKDREKYLAYQREKARRYRAAHPGYYAEYRKRNKAKVDEAHARSNAKHPERKRARQRVNNRMRHQWPNPSVFKCTDCDAQAQHYHHEDYALWWSIEPLCHKCHGVRHRKP